MQTETTAVPPRIPAQRSHTNFVLMILGRIISELGTSVFTFSVNLYVLNVTHSAALYSLVLSFSILPNLVSNFAGGLLVDRYNKKRLMVGSDFASGGLLFGFLVLFLRFPSNVLIIALCSMALAVTQNIFSLTMTSSIANTVNREQVPKLNSVFTGYGSAISVGGSFLGVLAYQNLSMPAIFCMNGLSFLFSAVLELFIVFYGTTREVPQKKQNPLKDYRNTLLYINGHRRIKTLFLVENFMLFVFAPLGSIIVPYVAYQVIDVSKFQFAVVQAGLPVGSLIASFIIMFLSVSAASLMKRVFRLAYLQIFGIMLACVPGLLVLFDQSKWISTSAFFAVLIFLGIVTVSRGIPISSYFQNTVDESTRGKFFAVQNTLSSLFSLLGIWLYGILLDHFAWTGILLVSAAVSIVVIFNIRRWAKHAENSGVNAIISENNFTEGQDT
ncbi:MFS transporter [Caproicibacterium amylolyticum]|uniref:MFS transporter n=1 Tax=Caproicibacterium amylolyticum TaxID=2766537 RepID=A0A7G9WJD3_9FIRM|nr:MFS transporter [Caproicibacterium amylolyticum]MBE6723076.1 MFS transporter [Oscillospiraceae bacterium]QNO18795.1 MFS transporter [Caproicibacterium amylolyticum]